MAATSVEPQENLVGTAQPDGFARGAAILLSAVAVASASFHIWTAGAGPLPGSKQTSIHVFFAVTLSLLNLRSATGSKPPTTSWGRSIDHTAIVGGIVVIASATVYVWIHFHRIVYELGYARPTGTDVLLGTLVLLVLFDACRRAMGWAFPVIGVVTILYLLFGDSVPGVFGHSGQTYSQVIGNSFTSPLGIYGNITATSANQIAIFVLFGALLMRLGGGDGFLKLALVVAGRLRGGPGKVSVLSSALFGMVNGSAVANTASTGVITIPMMKRYGFPKRFAAAVEATASTGGQWTPPIMGAAVFLMAQLLGMSYYSLILAAIIPAIIYYISFWVTVDSEAAVNDLQGLPASDIPRIRDFLDELVILIPPVVALLTLIIMTYPVRIAGFSATVILLIAAFSVRVLWKRRSLKEFGRDVVWGCRDGAITVAMIGVLVAASQVVVQAIGTTGVALNIGQIIFTVASASILLALVLAAGINILLGLALPTVPSYLIAVAITGTALIELGATPVSVHMFALYFAVLGGLTPPIGATVFVAAAIAETDWFRASLTALRIAAIAFVLPFVFVMRPELLLDGTTSAIITTSIFCAIAAVILAFSLSGYGAGVKLARWQSALLLVPVLLLLYPEMAMNVAGLVVVALLGLWQWRHRGVAKGRGVVQISNHSSATCNKGVSE